MVVLASRGRFMKNFRFDTICNITQEPQKLQEVLLCLWVYQRAFCDKNNINCYQKL